ncbi:MAG: hypothetical protein ACXW0G_06850 [Methylosarcina sp.]
MSMKTAEADHAPEKQAVFVIRADSFLIAGAAVRCKPAVNDK